MVEIASCPRCAQAVVGQGRYCTNCGADVRPPESDPCAESSADRQLIESLRRATIGEYEIREELGRGGMATVFLAHDIRLKKKVAVKVLSPHLQMLPGMATRFLREAQTAAGMEHPNIIPIYAYRETADFAFFTMRYVEGASLSAVAREIRQFPITTVRALLWDIGAALSCAHAHGVLHRDVKPGNVLLGRDGSVVVTDFGIAKQTEGHTLTMTGQLLGTPAYMSPEQCRGMDISFASDQYALGVMAYELVAGRLPFVSPAAGGLLAQHLMEAPPNILTFRPECPADLANAVMRMLAKDPSERFPSIDEALTAAGAVPVLPSDPARLQIRKWAEHPVHTRSLADTPLSPLVGSLSSAPTPTPTPNPTPAASAAVPPSPVEKTLVVRPPTPPVQEAAPEPRAAAFRNSRWVLFSPAAVAVVVTLWLLLRERPQPPAAPVVARGTLQVEQLPAGGAVFVDGAPVQGARAEMNTGRHQVRIEAPGFAVMDTVMNLVADSTATLVFASAKLPIDPPVTVPKPADDTPVPQPRKGVLVITGLPDGGRAVVDGRPIAGARAELAPGRHRIRLQAPGYVPVLSEVQVSAGATSTLVFASRPVEPTPTPPQPQPQPKPAPVGSGVLMLRVSPFARVFVDGAFKSEDNLVVISVREGSHQLRFEKPGYVTLETSVTVTAGDTLKKSFTIKPESP
jgi:serine/threonine protein kinase